MTPSDRQLCAVCAARAAGQLQVGWLGLALSIAAWVGLHVGPTSWPWLGVAALGIAERYVAARLAVDRQLFADMAQGTESLASLDAAMAALAMGAPASPPRPVADRARGLQGWARRHTALVVMQVVAAVVAVGVG